MIGGLFYQVVDQLVIDGLGVGGVSGSVGFVGNRFRLWHNGNVRRYLVVLLLGVSGVLAAVYVNPTVSQVGPSRVNPRFDLGGLRPTFGEQQVDLTILKTWKIRLGPKKAPARLPAPELSDQPQQPPLREPGQPARPRSPEGGAQ